MKPPALFRKSLAALTVISCFAGTVPPLSAALNFTVKPETFVDTGTDQLSETAVIEFLIQFNGVAYRDLIPGPGKAPTPEKKRQAVFYYMDWLQRETQHPPPYRLEELKELFHSRDALEDYKSAPAWTKIPVATEPVLRIEKSYTGPGGEKVVRVIGPSVLDKLKAEAAPDPALKDEVHVSSRSIGPLRLRRTAMAIDPSSDDIETTGPDAKILEAKGARIGFSDNRLIEGDGAWNTEGALILPFHSVWFGDNGKEEKRLHAALATSWNIQEQEKAETQDINELVLSLPLYFDFGRAGNFWTLSAEPYLHSDTDFEGKITGVTAAISFRGQIAESALKINEWHTWHQGRNRDLSGRFNARGLLDYSSVQEDSPWMTRNEGSEWLRIGGEAGYEFTWIGKQDRPRKLPPINLGFSYRYMDTIQGDGGDAGLFKGNLTWWINDYAGITAEYQKGDTPVAEQRIDLISLGLELRY